MITIVIVIAIIMVIVLVTVTVIVLVIPAELFVFKKAVKAENSTIPYKNQASMGKRTPEREKSVKPIRARYEAFSG